MNNSYFLSAIIGRGSEGFELRTEVFSGSNLEDLLREFPVALTMEPAGQAAAHRLLRAFASGPETGLLASQAAASSATGRWRCYRWMFDETSGHRLTFVDQSDIARCVSDLHSQANRSLAALVREEIGGNDWLSSAVDAAIAGAVSVGRYGYDCEPSSQSRETDRKSMLSRRHSLAQRVPMFKFEEIAGAFEPNSNASQRAADLRKGRRVFGVRVGWAWRYPKFQFDARRQVHPEMCEILRKLPDDQGWSRLEWFLTPHEVLNGDTPLSVWRRNRSLVVVAASTETWYLRRAAR